MCDKERVHGRPSDLGVPEPESRSWMSSPTPLLDMWSIPLNEPIGPSRVTVETSDAIGAVTDDGRRDGPTVVCVQHVSPVEEVRRVLSWTSAHGEDRTAL